MIRKNYHFGLFVAAFAFAPDAASIAGGASPAAQVQSTDNADTANDPDAKPTPGAGIAAADKSKLPPPPLASSANITAKPALATVAENPFSKQPGTTVGLHELRIIKLATYETDGKHIAGDTVWVNEGRADELISTGYAEFTGNTEQVEPANIRAFLLEHNTPPRV